MPPPRERWDGWRSFWAAHWPWCLAPFGAVATLVLLSQGTDGIWPGRLGWLDCFVPTPQVWIHF